MTARGARLPNLMLSGSHLRVIVADWLQVAGSVYLDQVYIRGHEQHGVVRLRGAHIDGDLFFSGAQLINDNGPALDAEAMQVKGTAYFLAFRGDNFCAIGRNEDGAVRLRNAHIGGRVYFNGAELTNQTGPALHAARLQVDNTLQLDNLTASGCSEDGAVRLRGARIGGRLYCRDARLTNQKGPGLSAARLHVEGSVHLERLRATGYGDNGAVRLRNASISGNLWCTSTHLSNEAGPALDAREMQLGEAAHLVDNFQATGYGVCATVRLRGARIGTRLEFGEGLQNRKGPVLDLRSVSVRSLRLPREAVNCPVGKGSRRHVTQERLLLDGLIYTTIPEPNNDLDNQWLRLLGECTRYAAQPYQQLASVYRAVGDEANARKILIKQQDDLGVRNKQLLRSPGARARHWLLGITIGYGYRTWPAFLGLSFVLILAIFLGLLAGRIHDGDRFVAAHTDKAAPAEMGTACSTAEQIGLGVERALPPLIGNTGIGDRCALESNSTAGQIITATGWVLQLAAWAFATLAVVGFTGLVRKT
jgi:hypothetical protein